jgi:iron complex outermembrane receptor protein
MDFKMTSFPRRSFQLLIQEDEMIKKKMVRAALAFLCIWSIACVVQPAVFAQEEDTFALEEIVVTAQKQEQNQQKVPITMDIVTGDGIQKYGKTDIEEILSGLSGVLINKASDGLRISLRGVSNDSPQSSTPTVGLNKDGVYSNRKSSGQDLYDVERVEVLYGPQGTLYASTTPGGIVNVVTASPKLDKFETYGLLEVGNYSLVHTEGAVNVPITDKLAVRTAFFTSVRDGYLSNGGDDEDAKSARMRVLYTPTDKLSFLISSEISKTSSYGLSGVVGFKNQDDEDNPWTSEDEETPTAGRETVPKYYGEITYDFNVGTLTVVPHYMENDSSTTTTEVSGASEVTTNTTSGEKEKGVEVRFSSPSDSKIDWMLAYNMYSLESWSEAYGTDGSWNIYNNEQETVAVFGNITYPITDTFRVNGGARMSWDTNDTYNERYPNRKDPSSPVPAIDNAEMEYDSPDFKLGLEYDLNEKSMLYASWSSSYRTQGGAFDSEGNPFPPEELDAYTIGAKNRFLDNRLQVNAAVWYYAYDNYLATDLVNTISQKDVNGDGDFDDTNVYDPDTGGTRDETLSVRDENAKQVGSLNMMGVDLSINTVLSSQDLLNLSIAYLKAEYDEMYFDYYDSTNSLGIPDMDYSGKEKTFSPKWSISADYRHEFHLPNGGIVTAKIDARYQSSYKMTFNTVRFYLNRDFTGNIVDITDYTTQEAYFLSNLSATYAPPDGKWTLTGYVNNIEDYAVKKSYLMAPSGNTMVIGVPRTYGFVYSVRF